MSKKKTVKKNKKSAKKKPVKKKGKTGKHPGGRPTKITPSVVSKLKQAASLDCSISEMCFYAEISRDTYYKLIKRDKELSDSLTAMRNRPVLKARQAVVKGLDNHEFALKYLERKLAKEFAPSHKIGIEGAENKPVFITYVPAKKNRKN